MVGWVDHEADGRYCACCGLIIQGTWVIEVDGKSYHAARSYRGPDRRRCRDVAIALKR